MGSDMYMEEEQNLKSHIEQLQIRCDYNQKKSDYWDTMKLDLHKIIRAGKEVEPASWSVARSSLDYVLEMEKSDCPSCKNTGMQPSHTGSRRCESGSIASGGLKSHCSCDSCF